MFVYIQYLMEMKDKTKRGGGRVSMGKFLRLRCATRPFVYKF